jgi:hypothetical protein
VQWCIRSRDIPTGIKPQASMASLIPPPAVSLLA